MPGLTVRKLKRVSGALKQLLPPGLPESASSKVFSLSESLRAVLMLQMIPIQSISAGYACLASNPHQTDKESRATFTIGLQIVILRSP